MSCTQYEVCVCVCVCVYVKGEKCTPVSPPTKQLGDPKQIQNMFATLGFNIHSYFIYQLKKNICNQKADGKNKHYNKTHQFRLFNLIGLTLSCP